MDISWTIETDERGAEVKRGFCKADRYFFDFHMCTPDRGWQQYDTEQDAWYFGIWIHAADRKILTYAEGDISLVTCPSEEIFQAELAHMNEFYGSPPPALRVIDASGVTDVYDEAAAFGRPLPEAP